MRKITLTTVGEMSRGDLLEIVLRLTRPGSEFQAECNAARHNAGSDTPIALWYTDNRVRGWACSHVWQNQQTLEMFVAADARGCGIASALSQFLIAAGVIWPEKTLAVFSPVTARIANRLGCVEVLTYQSSGSDWILAQ